MSTTIKIIRILFWSAIVSVMLAYAISLNIENGFLCLNSRYISNDFAFAIVGGVFASILVVLICEIHKYLDTKRRVEMFIFSQFSFLYAQLGMIFNTANRLLQNPEERLADQTLSGPKANAMICINNIKNCEYRTFRGKGALERNLMDFFVNWSRQLEGFVIDCDMLNIALRQDRIMEMEKGISCPLITSTHSNSHRTLLVLNKRAKVYLDKVDSFLIELDKECDGRYQWVSRRNNVNAELLNDKNISLEEFLLEGER